MIHLHTLSDILLLRSGKWKSARPPAHDWLLVLSFHSGVSICRVVKLQNKTFRTQEWDQGFSVSVTDSYGKIFDFGISNTRRLNYIHLSRFSNFFLSDILIWKPKLKVVKQRQPCQVDGSPARLGPGSLWQLKLADISVRKKRAIFHQERVIKYY